MVTTHRSCRCCFDDIGHGRTSVFTIDHVETSRCPLDVAVCAAAPRRDRRAFRGSAREDARIVERPRAADESNSGCDGAIRGNFFETDFASFIAWRDWGFPDAASSTLLRWARSAPPTALISSASWASNGQSRPGLFPVRNAGSGDIAGDTVDLAGSVLREVAEETGLDRMISAAERNGPR